MLFVINHYKQKGATLIEVLVSAFILAIGILAITTMQIRTSSSIVEAENTTIIANEVQNFAQTLLINPTLNYDNNTKTTTRNYNYPEFQQDCANLKAPDGKITQFNKASFAGKQFQIFCSNVSKNIPAIDPNSITLKICNNESISKELDTSFTCTGGGSQTIIKVAWKMQTANEAQKTNNSEEEQKANQPIIAQDGSFTNFYQMVLPQ